MAFTIRDAEIEALANEVAALAGESKTEAVGRALIERRDRLRLAAGGNAKRDLGRLLETHVWPTIPANVLGRKVTKAEAEEYLGFGPGGI